MQPCPVASRPLARLSRLLGALLCLALLAPVRAPAQTAPTPYGGSPVTVGTAGPARVEAENYDLGGEGVAYHDTENGTGTNYRADNVGTVPDGNASNGERLGWNQPGEWEGYTVSVPSAGSYSVTAYVGAPGAGGTFHLEFGPVGQVGGAGVTRTAEFTTPNTGDWGAFQAVTVPAVSLPAGTQWMRLVMDGGTEDVDYFSLTAGPGFLLGPTGLSATAVSGSEIDLSWSASAGATGYVVERSPDGSTGWAQVGTATTTTYTDTGLTAGTTYYYRVKATAGGVASGPSNVASATLTQRPLAAPQLAVSATNGVVVGNPSVGSLALIWTAVAGATGYNLYRSTTQGGEGTVPVATGISGNVTTYTDGRLTNGTTYYYRIAATGAGGQSGQSNEASATPGSSLLAAPQNLTAMPAADGGQSISLSWSPVAGATSYNVYRGLGNGDAQIEAVSPSPIGALGLFPLYQTSIAGTTFTDTGVAFGPQYAYYVCAVCTNGQGNPSNTARTALIGFGVGVPPTPLTVTRDSVTACAVTVTPSGGFTGPVILSGGGLPSGITAWFYPASVTLPTVNTPEYGAGLPSEGIGGVVSSGLYLAISATTPPGQYTVQITGQSGSDTNTASLVVIIK